MNIINILTSHWEPRNIRVGDMLAFCNVAAHQNVKFYFDPLVINDKPHCRQFLQFLIDHTDYVSITPGDRYLPLMDIWRYRIEQPHDAIKIINPHPQQKKLCIFPVFDAGYNTFRNWSVEMMQGLIDHYSLYDGYEKVVCGVELPAIDYRGFTISSDYLDNLKHIMTCEIFIGGDTGTSHFAGSLDRAPRLIYLMSERVKRQNTSVGTWVTNGAQMPMHFRKRGEFIYYSA
jgi:ADP-heptose:LPS heptosyltransferase